MPVSDEAYQEPFLIYHRNSRGPALEQDPEGFPLDGTRRDSLDRLHDLFDLDVAAIVLAGCLLATHARIRSFDRRPGRLLNSDYNCR